MIRLVNIAFLIIIIVLIAAVYHIRYSAEAEHRTVQRVQRAIAEEHDAQRMLYAEWSSLNDPRRLQVLASRYLDLTYVQASQVIDPRRNTIAPIPILLPEHGFAAGEGVE